MNGDGHHCREVGHGAFAIAGFGRKHRVEVEDPRGRAQLPQLWKEHAEHRGHAGIFALGNQRAHRLGGPRPEQALIRSIQLAACGESEHRPSRGGAQVRNGIAVRVDPADRRVPLRIAGSRRFGHGLEAIGVRVRIAHGLPESDQGFPVQRPRVLVRRLRHCQPLTEPGERIHRDHRRLQPQVGGERDIDEDERAGQVGHGPHRLAECAVERRSLGDRGGTKRARRVLRVAERRDGIPGRTAGGERLLEMRAELALDVRALRAAQAGLPCHAVNERGDLGRQRAHAYTASGVRARPRAPIAAVNRRHVRVSSASRFFPSGVSR